MNTKEVKKSKYAIVNAVVVALNLGDYGKIEGFVQKTVKVLEREVDTLERNIVNAEHNFQTSLSENTEKLEDAQQCVEDAYTNLNPDNLKTNEAQRDYMETYLERIDTAEGKVLGIERSMEEEKERHDENIKEFKEQIAVRKTRITRLTKGVTS